MFFLILIMALMIGFIFASVIIHEYGHALVAEMLGWKRHGMTLRWFGASYKIEINQEKPTDIWKIAAGGLIATLALFALGLWLSLIAPVFLILAYLNFFIFAFNVLPFKGLDGYYIAKGAIGYFRRPNG